MQIPIILLYKSMEKGNFHQTLDPRAGRFAVSRTTVKDYMFGSPERVELQLEECLPTADQIWTENKMLNEVDV